jgi:hypothetical protein
MEDRWETGQEILFHPHLAPAVAALSVTAVASGCDSRETEGCRSEVNPLLAGTAIAQVNLEAVHPIRQLALLIP